MRTTVLPKGNHGKALSLNRTGKVRVSIKPSPVHLAVIEADIHKGAWIDPSSGRITVAEYGAKWIDERVTLRPRTRELYKRLLTHQIAPDIGKRTIADLTPSEVRTWHAQMAKEMPSTAAKAYRVLATMMRTALEDGLITQTPCRIRGAGNEKAKERPVASVEEVTQIVALVPERYRALILLTAWAGLRRGEVLALERQDLDLVNGKVRIERAVQHMTNGEYYIGPPKTAAGARTVHFPKEIIPAIESHLNAFSGPEKTDLVFPGEVGGTILRPHVLYKHWHIEDFAQLLEECGVDDRVLFVTERDGEVTSSILSELDWGHEEWTRPCIPSVIPVERPEGDVGDPDSLVEKLLIGTSFERTKDRPCIFSRS